MIEYPLKFQVSGEARSGIDSIWAASVPSAGSDGVRELPVAIPPEFAGPGRGFSPEDFYALALLNCFTATFKVIAERSKLEYSSISSSGVLTVDRDEKGAPYMKHFALKVSLQGSADPERARRLLEKTSQSCMILNSVKTEKAFEFEVSGT
jgi:organic hydroperoxide reductase OsmC/OhrA